jgi:hypothetical protein
MQLRFFYTFKDYREANESRSRFNRILNAFYTFFALLLSLGFLLMLTGSLKVTEEPGSYLSYIPVLILAFFFSPFGRRLVLYWRWRQQPILHRELRYDINDDAVAITTDTSSSEMKWETFDRFAESKNLFLLFVGKFVFYMIPKRAFADASEVSEFRRLASTRVPAGRRQHRL